MLSEVVIEDFQSHEKTVVALSPGYNCFIGPTDIGKSSCLRAIRWALCNDLTGTKFIRNVGTTATVQLTFDNGTRVIRFKSRKTSNGYKVEKPNEPVKLYDKIGDALPLEVTDECKVVPIIIDSGWQMFPQFQGQFDPPFLISETAPKRAKMIHRLSYSHIVDEALRLARQDALASSRKVTELTERKAALDVALVAYETLETRLAAVEKVQQLQQQQTVLQERLMWVKKLVADHKAAEQLVLKTSTNLTLLAVVDTVSLDQQLSQTQQLETLLPSYKAAISKQIRATQLLNQIPEALLAQGSTLDTWQQWVDFFSNYRTKLQAHNKATATLQVATEGAASVLTQLKSVGACPTCGKPLSPEELEQLVC